MAVPVLMPKQGQSVESCIITEWLKKKGEDVKKGDILFAYETDKATFEEEAAENGILLDIFFEEGDEVPVLVNIAVIGSKGESTEEFRSESVTTESIKDNEIEEQVTVKNEAEIKTNPVNNDNEINLNGKIKMSPRAKRLAEKLKLHYQSIKGSGPQGRIVEKDIEALAKISTGMTSSAQQKASVEGLQPSLQGTGLGGRILDNELDTASVYGNDYEDKKLSNIRKIIAKGMHASLQNSAQLTHHMSADVRKLLAYRKEVKALLEKGGTDNITLNDMVCYAVIKALQKHPSANSHFLGESIREFKNVHLGIAVDTLRGLMVPTLKNANDLSLKGLSKQLKVIANQCKQGSIDPELLAATSATFTISNLGAYGVELFTPVINLPQVGILGVNTILPKPKDLGDGVFAFIPHIGLSLTYDHRAIDGGPATLFLKEIKDQIEGFETTNN